MTNHPNRAIRYDLTDAYGRSYFEGRSFSRDAALAAAKEISEESRPFGIYLIPETGGKGDELFAPIKTTD